MKPAKITKRDGTIETVGRARKRDPDFEKRTQGIVKALEKGMSIPDIAEKFGVSKQTVYNTKARYSNADPKVNSPGLPSARTRLQEQAESALSDELKERIRDMRDHDMTTSEIANELAAELDWDVDALKKEVEKIMSRNASRGAESHAGAAALGPDRYKVIRAAMHDREFSSAQYALTNKLSPKEVNAAVRSMDYTNYLDIRA